MNSGNQQAAETKPDDEILVSSIVPCTVLYYRNAHHGNNAILCHLVNRAPHQHYLHLFGRGCKSIEVTKNRNGLPTTIE